MFAENMLESGAWKHTGRGWAAFASLGLQSLVIAALAAVPMMHLDVLRLNAKAEHSVPTFTAVVEQQPHPSGGERFTSVNLSESTRELTVPRNFNIATTIQDPGSPPEIPMSGSGSGAPNGPLSALTNTFEPPPVVRMPTRPPRVSEVNLGALLERVTPIYPGPARQAGIQGEVVLSAIISRTGQIENLTVLRGHPFLSQAAIDAVKRWKYRPYIMNGEPIEVETQITVNFRLNQ